MSLDGGRAGVGDGRLDTDRPEELRGQLEDAHARAFELSEQLAGAREELEAVREINRELLSDRNRPSR